MGLPVLPLVSPVELSSDRCARIDRFLDDHPDLATPFLVVDLDIVADRYLRLCSALPASTVYYAVKANPDPAVLGLLAALGSSFDVASVGEIERCLDLGIGADRLSYGNTLKKARDVARAYECGVRVFAVDSRAELDKLVACAPDAMVLVRLETDGGGAEWPLSHKFGCSPAEAEVLLHVAAAHGLELGVSFHVGSQQHDLRAWDAPLHAVARLRESLAGAGHRLSVVNLGGGLPSRYSRAVPPVDAYGDAIERAITEALGDHDLRVMVEPGRFLVGDAGLIRSEVVLITDKQSDSGRRWVYLDIGMFNGLAETQGEAIRYELRCPDTSGQPVPAVVAGPTCDSVDVLYERTPYPLPDDLRIGGYVDVLSAGAYTSSYSSVWFNGFEPLGLYVLPSTLEL